MDDWNYNLEEAPYREVVLGTYKHPNPFNSNYTYKFIYKLKHDLTCKDFWVDNTSWVDIEEPLCWKPLIPPKDTPKE